MMYKIILPKEMYMIDNVIFIHFRLLETSVEFKDEKVIVTIKPDPKYWAILEEIIKIPVGERTPKNIRERLQAANLISKKIKSNFWYSYKKTKGFAMCRDTSSLTKAILGAVCLMDWFEPVFWRPDKGRTALDFKTEEIETKKIQAVVDGLIKLDDEIVQ